MGRFTKEYVARNVFPREFGRRLGMLKQLREKSDYDDFYIASKEQADEQYHAAEYVIANVDNYLSAEGK